MMDDKTETPAPVLIEVEITTFGVLHGQAPAARRPESLIRIDLTSALRNPHSDPAMRELTGEDRSVFEHVMGTEGAAEILDEVMEQVLTQRFEQRRGARPCGLIEVHSFCKGGRHRSVAMALALRDELGGLGIGADVIHLDMAKPVVKSGEVPAGHRG